MNTKELRRLARETARQIPDERQRREILDRLAQNNLTAQDIIEILKYIYSLIVATITWFCQQQGGRNGNS